MTNDASPSAGVAAGEDEHVLWDVMEEHLDEVEYCCGELEAQLDHATLSLSQVEDGIEARLRAHVDGLVIGGEVVARNLLATTFADEEVEPERIAAAAFALMHGSQPKLAGEALLLQSEIVRRAALRGITLADPKPIRAWALDRFREKPAPEITANLLPLVAARIEPAALLEYLQSDHAGLAASAARVVSTGPKGIFLPCIEALIGHDSPDVARHATLAGLAWGSNRAWASVSKRALSGEPQHAASMALYAALSSPNHHARLVEFLKRDELRADALFALGFTGNPEMMSALLEHLASENASEAKIAAQSIQLITGLDTQDDAYCLPVPEPGEPTILPEPEDDPEAQESLPEFEKDDLDADLRPRPEDAMPEPNAAAVRKWWSESSGRFSNTQRYVLGQPLSVDALIYALESARMRVRHVLAEMLGVRTGGELWLDTRDLVSRQRARMHELRALQVRSFARQFGYA